MDFKTGTIIGSYEIVSELGRGGMAVVYKAYQRSLERHVALKLLADFLAHDASFVERFLREAKIAARLNHPNIVTIFEVSETPPYYIAMEYIEGGSIAKLIREEGTISPARTAAILRQVASALDEAHKNGVVHRDLKPSNVILDATGRPILTDFGIAKARESTKLTQTGMVMGTPEYMAPEEIQGQPASAASDIYSLGVIVYEMLAGRVPFRAETPLAVLHQHVYTNLPPLRQFNSRVTPQVEQVLNKALAKKSTDRFQSAGQFSRAFDRAIGIANPTPVDGSTVMVPTLTTRKSSAWLWMGFGAVLILIISVIALVVLNRGLAASEAMGVPAFSSTQISEIVTQTPFANDATSTAPTLELTQVSPPTQAELILPTITEDAEPVPTDESTPDRTAAADADNTRIAALLQATLNAQSTETSAAATIVRSFIRTQTAIAAATETARPTNTRRPTARPAPTETPTFTPPPTSTPLPRGVWVMNVESVPSHIAPNATAYFRVTFLNTTGGLAYWNWCVEIFQKGNRDHAFSNTECKPRTIPAGETAFNTEPYRTGCGLYEMRVIWVDPVKDSFNARHAITKPDGSTAWSSFSVCP